MWHVYLLKCSDNTFYCGISSDLERRLQQHNGLLPGGARYTRGRRPVELLGSIGGLSQGEALRIEARLKQLSKGKKLEGLLQAAKSASDAQT